MAYNSPSSHQHQADDPFFNKDVDKPPIKSRAHPPYGHIDRVRSASGPRPKLRHPLNTAITGYGPEAYPALSLGQLLQTPGRPQFLQETTFASSGDHFRFEHGNPQHQSGWGLESPPVAPSNFPQPHANQRDGGLVPSPTAANYLPQATAKQQDSNPLNSPTPRGPSSASKSVKHLTCWYWANKGCILPDDVCLYSHFDTGRLAEPPVQVQRGRPAVAGTNATKPQPLYRNWKGHRRAHSALVDPLILRQLQHIHEKAAQPSTPTSRIAEQIATAEMVKTQGFSSTEPPVDYNRPHPDNSTSPAPADSYHNMSIGIGASNHPFQQQFNQPSPQIGGNFVPPSPAALYSGGSTQYGGSGSYGIGGPYGGMGGQFGGMGSPYGGMGAQFGGGHDGMGGNGPSPHRFIGNSRNDPNPFSPSGQYSGHSGGPTSELQNQMKIKDQVITELAGLVEMLEINYGFSIKDQIDSFDKFMTIAASMEKEARDAASSGTTKERASDVPATSTSGVSYGHPPANHERIITAMEGAMNLIRMEKMVLDKSRARKQEIGGRLESIEASKLLPHAWIER